MTGAVTDAAKAKVLLEDFMEAKERILSGVDAARSQNAISIQEGESCEDINQVYKRLFYVETDNAYPELEEALKLTGMLMYFGRDLSGAYQFVADILKKQQVVALNLAMQAGNDAGGPPPSPD